MSRILMNIAAGYVALQVFLAVSLLIKYVRTVLHDRHRSHQRTPSPAEPKFRVPKLPRTANLQAHRRVAH